MPRVASTQWGEGLLVRGSCLGSLGCLGLKPRASRQGPRHACCSRVRASPWTVVRGAQGRIEYLHDAQRLLTARGVHWAYWQVCRVVIRSGSGSNATPTKYQCGATPTECYYQILPVTTANYYQLLPITTNYSGGSGISARWPSCNTMPDGGCSTPTLTLTP